MNLFSNLISKDGRLSRNGYLLYFVLPGAALLAATYAVFSGVVGFLPASVAQVISVGWVVYLSTMDAQNIRRYHDLGSSGGFYRLARPFVVILPLLAFAVQFLIPAQLASSGDLDALAFLIGQEAAFNMSPVPLGIMVLWFVGVAGNIVYLAVMPGQPGANTYGPGPGQGAGPLLAGSGASGAAAGGDPVERALAEYQASLARSKPAYTAGSPPRPGQAGATFGRKR